MMGKYSGLVKIEDAKPQEECHPNALKLYLLAGIADELAEANRLKKIELQIRRCIAWEVF